MDAYGNLYVADALNNRVLEYNTPLTYHPRQRRHHRRHRVRAGRQLRFAYPEYGGVSANSLNFPDGVAVDASGDLYVADSANNRVLEYNTPLAMQRLVPAGGPPVWCSVRAAASLRIPRTTAG